METIVCLTFMLLCYDWGIYPPEANVLENIWRESICRCIAQKKRIIVTMFNAAPRTSLPEELWDYLEELMRYRDSLASYAAQLEANYAEIVPAAGRGILDPPAG